MRRIIRFIFQCCGVIIIPLGALIMWAQADEGTYKESFKWMWMMNWENKTL